MSTLRETFDNLCPISPTVYYTDTSNNSNDKNAKINTLHCQQMEYNIECFVQTASINMVATWKNNTSEYMHCLFMIPMRANITDCFIHIGNERIRSIGLIEKTATNISYGKMEHLEKEAKKDENKYENREEWDLIEDLFASQLPGYFRIPFDNIKPNQNVRVDLYYVETLKIINNAFYISIPTTFNQTTISNSNKWNNIITKINATIYHLSEINATVVSKSHQLQIVRNNNCMEVTANTLKNNASEDIKEDTSDIYGTDFELQYYFATETFSATLFMNDSDEKDEDTIEHYLLISPQTECHAFDRNICFLVDRSTRSSLIWTDIVRAIEHCLERMNESDRFSIILYDTDYISWGTEATQPIQLHYAKSESRKSAIGWMNVYKPDPNKLNSKLERPLYETLKLIKQSTSNTCGSYCVIIGSSYYGNEKDIINKMMNLKSNYDKKGVISQRIYSVSIGNGINKYFLNYLSLISRGKSIAINNPKTVYNELIGFFNEFRSPMVCDIDLNIEFANRNVSFKPEQMIHSYPINDLCFNHPMILKLSIPNISEYKIKQIIINGNFVNKHIEIPVIISEYKYKFPIDIILAETHLNYLHSNIWYLSDGLNENTNIELMKFKANQISDKTGLASPTRVLQSIQEIIEQVDEKKEQDLSALKLPPRTGRGARRKNKKMSKKNKAAAIGVVAAVGTVAVVTVLNPFGGGDGIFGGGTNALGELGGGDCECCGECGGDCGNACGDGCQDICVIL